MKGGGIGRRRIVLGGVRGRSEDLLQLAIPTRVGKGK